MKKQYISLLVIALAISCQVLGAVTEVNLEVDPIISHHYSEAEHNIRDILSFALPSATLEPGDVYRVNVSFTNGKLLKVTGASYVAIGPVFSTAGYGNILGLTNNGNIGLEITSYQNILNTSRSGTAFCRKVYRGDDYYFEKAFFFERSLGEIVDGSLFEAFTVEFTVPTTVEGAPFSTRAYSSNSVRIEADLQNTFWDHNILTVIPRPSKTYYVDTTEGSDNNDGLSPQTAFATIQKAIDSAYNGDTVLVADGTYTGPGNRDIDFLGKAITVRSENGPENCIIDCNGTQEELPRGFYFHSGEGTDSVLDGFTITNGCAYKGGAIYCRYSSSPTITDCIIRGNVSPAAPGFPWYFLQDGGGIYCSESNPIIRNCHFIENIATAGGGAIFSWRGNALVDNCVINSNSAGISGGGIECIEDNMYIHNCVVSGNNADFIYYGGGGIYCNRSTPTINNCTISGNLAAGQGGGIYMVSNNAIVTNTILWDNAASEGPEIGLRYGAFGPASLAISYSDVRGGAEGVYVDSDCTLNWGQGNIYVDPCFVEPGYWVDANDPNIIVEPNDPNAVWIDGDYHLLPSSRCIDAGDPCYIPEPNETDIDGNPRVINGRIDMGAYETNYIQAAMKLTPQMLNYNSKGKYIKAHFVLPQEFLPEDVDVNEAAVAEPMGAESEYIKVFGAGTGPVRLEICFDRETFCAQITETGEVEITVIGSLTTGRYFYATDTIRIKPQH